MPDATLQQGNLWRLRETVTVYSKVSWHLARTRRPDISNRDDVDRAERARSLAIGYHAMLATPWPADFPTPQLAMPDRQVTYLRRFALAPDFRPRTDICRVEEIAGMILVTDAVALRVLRARCVGPEFADPTIGAFAETNRIHTVTGIAEVTN